MPQVPIKQQFQRVGEALVPADLVTADGQAVPTRAEVEAAAEVDPDEVNLSEGQILIGDGTGKAAAVGVAAGEFVKGDSSGNAVPQALSGDVTVDGAGVATITDDAIDGQKIAAAQFRTEVIDGQNESTVATIPVAGLAAGDELMEVLVFVVGPPSFIQRALSDFAVGDGGLTVVANPGQNSVNQYLVRWIDKTP